MTVRIVGLAESWLSGRHTRAQFEGRLVPDGPGCRLTGSIEPVPPRFFVAFWFGFLGLMLVLLTYVAIFHVGYEPNGPILGPVVVIGIMALGFITMRYQGHLWEGIAEDLAGRLTAAISADSPAAIN